MRFRESREFDFQILRAAGMAHLFVFHVTPVWHLMRCLTHQPDGEGVLCAAPVVQDVR